MGIISTIKNAASNVAAKAFGKGKKPHAQVTSVTTDGKGEIQSVTYDGVPHKTTSQKLREFNKKTDEKMKEEYLGTGGGTKPTLTQRMFGSAKTDILSETNNEMVFKNGTRTTFTNPAQKERYSEWHKKQQNQVTWGGRPVGQVAGEAAGNILRGLKRGVQATGKATSKAYASAKATYIKAEPERHYLQFMSGVKIAKKTNVLKGKNLIGGKKRGRKTKEEKKAVQKEILYERNVITRLKKQQMQQPATFSSDAFRMFDQPIGMGLSNRESPSSKPFFRKADNPYDINAQFKKARIKL